MFLDSGEVQRLTGYARHKAQAKALTRMGIEHLPNPKGGIIVLRAHVEHRMGMKVPTRPKTREAMPNWGALQNA